MAKFTKIYHTDLYLRFDSLSKILFAIYYINLLSNLKSKNIFFQQLNNISKKFN